MTNNTGNVLVAVLTGAIIGTGIGILYAPDKGTMTRKKIKKSVNHAKEDITERLSHAKEELTKTMKSKKEDFEHKLEDTISDMSYKADDIINTLERKLEDIKKKNAHLQKQ